MNIAMHLRGLTSDHGNYGLVTAVFLVVTIILTTVGKEAKDVQFGTGAVEPVRISA